MFGNFDGFLRGEGKIDVDKDGAPTSKELKVAVLAVLVEMAHKDSKFDADELTRITQVFFKEYDLLAHETAELCEIVDFLRRNGKLLSEYLSTINQHFSPEQKISILAMAWKIVMADGQAEKFEAIFAAELRTSLGLTLEQAVRARQMAEKEKFSLEIPQSSE